MTQSDRDLEDSFSVAWELDRQIQEFHCKVNGANGHSPLQQYNKHLFLSRHFDSN